VLRAVLQSAITTIPNNWGAFVLASFIVASRT